MSQGLVLLGRALFHAGVCVEKVVCWMDTTGIKMKRVRRLVVLGWWEQSGRRGTEMCCPYC